MADIDLTKMNDMRKKAMDMVSLSPEELGKKIREAEKIARDKIDSLTPEQRQKVEAGAEDLISKAMGEKQGILSEAKKFFEKNNRNH